MVRRLATLCIATTLLGAAPGLAGERLDRHGDPLPPGALFRLGKVERLRQPGSAATLALSPDGRVLASAGSIGTVCLWALPSGKELHTLTGHEGPVHCVAFSRDGALLASVGQDRTVRIHETTTGKLYQRWYCPPGVSRALAFSPDGRLLAVGGTYAVRGLRVWVIRTGLEVDPSYFDHESVRAVAFSPDGKTVAAGGDSGCLLWETATGKQLARLDRFAAPQRYVVRLQFGPGGKSLFLGGSTGMVAAWDTTTRKEIRQFRAHKADLLGMALSADGTRLATCGGDGIKVWDPHKGTELRRYAATEEETAVALALSADGKTLATGTASGRLRLWGVAGAPGRPAAERASVLAVAVSPDGRALATLERGAVRLWDAGTGKPLRALAVERERLRCLAYAPSGRPLATGGLAGGDGAQRGQLRLWDPETGKPLWAVTFTGGEVRHLAFTPDGKAVVVLSGDRNVSVHDTATGKELRRLHPELPALDSLALSADGRLLACAPVRGPAQTWDLASGTKAGQFGDRLDRFLSLAFTPDGRTLAAVSADGHVRLWELASGKERVRLSGFGRLAALRRNPGLTFSPDGRLVAVSRSDLSVSVWDTALRTELAEFRGHRDAVCTLAFAPNGRSLVSGSWDTTALVWDMKDRQKPGSVRGPLSETDLERAWVALRLPDPAMAHAALWSLVESPRQAVALFAKRLRPEATRERTAEQMIADLNSPRYALRNKATAELARLGERARPALVRALANGPTLETRRRIEGLLEKLGRSRPNPEDLRAVRALEVLERIGTPEARHLVEALARGSGDGLLTIEARATRARLARGAPSP